MEEEEEAAGEEASEEVIRSTSCKAISNTACRGRASFSRSPRAKCARCVPFHLIQEFLQELFQYFPAILYRFIMQNSLSLEICTYVCSFLRRFDWNGASVNLPRWYRLK